MTLLLLLMAALDLGPREAGPIRARLRVIVPSQGVAPGLAAVRLELETSGPETMRLDGPRLEDALSAWRVVSAASSWSAGRESWTAELEQTKPGVAGLPGVALRVRSRSEDEWRDLAWHDPLGETLGVAPPQPLPAPPATSWWPWIAGVAALLLGGAAARFRRRPRPESLLSSAARASAALDALVGTPAQKLDSLVAILRRHLAEEPGRAALFADLLTQAEKARFGPSPPGQEALDRAIVQAREAIGMSGKDSKIGTRA